jgi:hypothetical protein
MRAHLLGSVRDLRSSTSDAMTQQYASVERSQADDSASSWATPCLAATDNAFVQSRRRTHLLDLLNLLKCAEIEAVEQDVQTTAVLLGAAIADVARQLAGDKQVNSLITYASC